MRAVSQPHMQPGQHLTDPGWEPKEGFLIKTDTLLRLGETLNPLKRRPGSMEASLQRRDPLSVASGKGVSEHHRP